jgi:hypothetical protein
MSLENRHMKLFALAVAATAVLAAPALAHPEHDEMPRQFKEKSVTEKAQDAVMREITRAKLDPSWRAATPGEAELRSVKGVPQWVVPFKNAKAKKATERTLYVRLTQGGEFIGTGFSTR